MPSRRDRVPGANQWRLTADVGLIRALGGWDATDLPSEEDATKLPPNS